MRKVYHAAGNGVQPLVPVFQLSFLSGSPDCKGRKPPTDPCTCHCKRWWLLKKRVLPYMHGFISPPIPLLCMLQIMIAITGLAVWDAHWEMKRLLLWPLVCSPNSAEYSLSGNMAGLEQGPYLLLLLWVNKWCKKAFSNVESNTEIYLLPLCS